jgi:hypothetical protein
MNETFLIILFHVNISYENLNIKQKKDEDC